MYEPFYFLYLGALAFLFLAFSFLVFSHTSMRLRDEAVANRITELARSGAKGVLIVRGGDHIKPLASMLKEKGIMCEEFSS